jgi:hypothetical protein
MPYSYDGESNWDRIQMLVFGLVAGALLVGLAWMIQWWLTSGEPDSTTSGSLSSASRDGGDRTAALDERAARCQEVFAAQAPVLTAVRPAMSQWEVHIGAMNQWVVGAITTQQANQFWNKTREGAWLRLARFKVAVRQYDERTARCPRPTDVQAHADELGACQKAVAERGHAVRLARRALETWRMHVHHMDMLRAGEMTPEEASALWLQSWREGDREVTDYRAAARQAAAGPRC